MNVDCLLIILEQLKFHDLLKVSQTNRFLSMLTVDVFHRELASKTISIVTSRLNPNGHPVYESVSRILLQAEDISIATLTRFGSQIKRLSVDFGSMSSNKRSDILRLINEHCSQSLQFISFDQCDKNTFNHLVVPFEKVETLIVSDFVQTIDGNLKLNEIFPNISHLNLAGVEILAPNTLDVKFEHLTELNVTISLLNNIYPHIKKLIRKNPQIRSLSLIYCNSFEYIQLASNQLKHLKTLQLNLEILEQPYRESKIHFPSVKNLKMVWGLYDFSNVMSFSHLETLDLHCLDGVEFAAQFKNLTELNLIQNEIRGEDILKLSENLTNLKQLTVSTESKIEEHVIFHLIEQCHNLNKLQLKSDFGHIFRALKWRFGIEWTMAQRGKLISMQKIDQSI